MAADRCGEQGRVRGCGPGCASVGSELPSTARVGQVGLWLPAATLKAAALCRVSSLSAPRYLTNHGRCLCPRRLPGAHTAATAARTCLRQDRRSLATWAMALESLLGHDVPFEVTTFPNDEGYDELVVASQVPFCSLCAHHPGGRALRPAPGPVARKVVRPAPGPHAEKVVTR